MDDEALHNKIKQNQAYNDHIVSQQAEILAKLDSISALEECIKSLEIQADIADNDHEKLAKDHNDVKRVYNDEIGSLKDKVEILIQIVGRLSTENTQLFEQINKLHIDHADNLEEIKNDFATFKKVTNLNWSIITTNVQNNHEANKRDLSDHFRDVLKMVPETPPYIQDLKDRVDHNLRVFEIKVDQVLDKCTHMEMLYAVLQKRTRG